MTALKALVDFNVTKKNQIVTKTHALIMLCARMNLDQEISHVCANLAILVKIVPTVLLVLDITMSPMTSGLIFV